MRRYLPLLGRILLGLIFVMSGFNKVTGFEGVQQYMASYGMPMTSVLLVGAIAVEVLGGLSIVLGVFPRLGAGALILFLIPATLIFHTDFGDRTQMIMFMKNLSIMGGLLFVIAHGSGTASLYESSSASPVEESLG